MEEKNKSGVTIVIQGGTNQIAPNATEQKQIFVGDKYADAMLQSLQKPESASAPAQTKAASPLSIYINSEELLSKYTSRLAVCTTARQIGYVVVDMVKDPDVKVDKDMMVKKEFIEQIKPLAPQVTTGVDNIRNYINEAWVQDVEKKMNVPG